MAPAPDLRRPGAARGRLVAALGVVLTSLVGAVVMLAVTAAPAAAHNALVSTAPSDGATIKQAPAEIVLTFDEPALALGTSLIITGPTGQQIQTGPPRLVDNTVTQTLQPGAPAGPYTVLWRVTSADGHPISGRFAYTTTVAAAGDASSPAAPTTPAPAPTNRDGSSLLPWLALLAVGAAAAVAVAGYRRRFADTEDPADTDLEDTESTDTTRR